jgi:hypothetical protein
MSQFVKQRNESAWYEKAIRPVACPHRCRKPTPSTLFIRFHPLRSDAEIRECPECRKQTIFPTGEAFR